MFLFVLVGEKQCINHKKWFKIPISQEITQIRSSTYSQYINSPTHIQKQIFLCRYLSFDTVLKAVHLKVIDLDCNILQDAAFILSHVSIVENNLSTLITLTQLG